METCKHIPVVPKDCAGSRLRCLLLSSLPKRQVAEVLCDLLGPVGSVNAECDQWYPRGLLKPQEAKLGECAELLDASLQEALTSWWLVKRRGANTPNWDIASTCEIRGKKGILLVEAKAHDGELHEQGKRPGKAENDLQITGASEEARINLERRIPGWAISRDTHYQLSNRFAWAWKIAEAGVPVALVYLGFLRADEMKDRGRPLASHEEWREVVLAHTKGIVPESVWNSEIKTNRESIFPLVRSIHTSFSVSLR